MENSDFETKLRHALKFSASPDNAIRKEAEQFILKGRHEKGAAYALLKISAQPEEGQENNQVDVCHAAAIQLGSLVEIHWKFKDDEHAQKIVSEGFDYIVLHEEDKEQVRANIMECLFKCTNKAIMKQYTRCMLSMCRQDIGTTAETQKWPGLLPQILQYLNTQDQKAVYTGLQGLLCLCKKFEYELEEDRIPLFEIVNQTFPILGGLVDNILKNASGSEDALHMLHLICKIFYVSNQLFMSPYLSTGDNIDPWIALFLNIINQQLPENLTTKVTDEDQVLALNKHIQWKCKAMAGRITYRTWSKYGNPDLIEGKELGEFSKRFIEKHGINLLEAQLKNLLNVKTQFIGNKSLTWSIKFIMSSIKKEITMEKLKSFMDQIMYDTILPIVMITERDEQLYQNEPIEYIRNQDDFTETMLAPKHQALDLLSQIVQYKEGKKKNVTFPYLKPYVQFAMQGLKDYEAQANPDWKIKEALLFCIGSIRDSINRDKELKAMIVPMLKECVDKELSSQHSMLRTRAVWIYGEFSNMFKPKSDQDSIYLQSLVEKIFMGTQDEALPLRVQAALSIRDFLDISKVKEILKPELEKILNVYLTLIKEIDNEELVAALETLMTKYQDDIHKYAIQVSTYLVEQYKRLVKTDVEDDDGEAALAAVGCVTSIRRLLDSVKKQSDLIVQIQQIIYPLLMHTLTPDGLDAIEDGVDCIAMLVYYTKQPLLSKEMWALFPQLLNICAGTDADIEGGYGFEYLNQIQVAIKNYIQRDPQTFLSVGEGQSKTYFAMTVDFINRCLKVNANGQLKEDGIVIMNIIICLFECLKGKMDEGVPVILGIIVNELETVGDSKDVKNYKSMVFQALSMSFHYNAILTMQVLDQQQKIMPVFTAWFQFMDKFKKEFEMRRVLFGLTSIVSIDASQQNQMISSQMQLIMQQLSNLSIKIKTLREKNLKENESHLKKSEAKLTKKLNAQSNDDGFEDCSDSDDEYGSQDDGSDFEEEYEHTKKQLNKLSGGAGGDMAGDLDDDDSDSDFDLDEDYEYNGGGDMMIYDSPLEDVDELIVVKSVCQELEKRGFAFELSDMAGFQEVLQGCENLKQQEDLCQQKIEELEKKRDQLN